MNGINYFIPIIKSPEFLYGCNCVNVIREVSAIFSSPKYPTILYLYLSSWHKLLFLFKTTNFEGLPFLSVIYAFHEHFPLPLTLEGHSYETMVRKVCIKSTSCPFQNQVLLRSETVPISGDLRTPKITAVSKVWSVASKEKKFAKRGKELSSPRSSSAYVHLVLHISQGIPSGDEGPYPVCESFVWIFLL
jgi:hypothetical protein